MTVTLGFYGGAGTVTGSRTLLTTDTHRVLVDCGLFQGLKDLRLLNWKAPAFDPRSVDDVLLTHAHIDHSGYLPRLVKAGFRGPIYATPATIELAGVLLRDAARLQEEDAEYANRKGFSKHETALPLFTEADAERTLGQFLPAPYDEWIDLNGGIRARFSNAGHILGAAHVEVEASEQTNTTNVVFSGDVGRYHLPLHSDPAPPPEAETMVLEATYGDRHHSDEPLIQQLRKPFMEALARGGTILIPAFAVARAQLVTLMLRDLMESGELPEVPIHIDSPMAVDVTQIYARYYDGTELSEGPHGAGTRSLFPRNVRFHRTVEESKQINKLKGPRIIISSSGMLTGGRVLHHLFRVLPNPRDLLVLAGYQAAGTRGRALQEGAKSLRIHGQDVPVRCHFVSLDGFSAHADADELLQWVTSGAVWPANVFVNHGETEAARTLVKRLHDELRIEAIAPPLNARYRFNWEKRAWIGERP